MHAVQEAALVLERVVEVVIRLPTISAHLQHRVIRTNMIQVIVEIVDFLVGCQRVAKLKDTRCASNFNLFVHT